MRQWSKSSKMQVTQIEASDVLNQSTLRILHEASVGTLYEYSALRLTLKVCYGMKYFQNLDEIVLSHNISQPNAI